MQYNTECLIRKSRLNGYKQNKLIELFVEGSTARTAATHVDVNKNTASYYFQRLRQIICCNNRYFESFSPEIKSDENHCTDSSCQRCHYYKGAQAHYVENEISIFILLKSNNEIFTAIVPDTKTNTLAPAIREKIKAGSIISSNSWRNHHTMGIPELKYSQANRLNIFCKQTKDHMRKFNGTPKEQFHLLFKEFAWRFNNPDPKNLLIQLNQWVKNDMGLLPLVIK
ncbi:MAG: IS1595 family transposase [Gammaproteobacteria bacterium]|nr:IS1595 family transposase [Gammaproteobacteria bacterium]